MTKNVTRYEVLDRDGSDENVAGHPHVDGEWVRYDDIKHLLHDEPRCDATWQPIIDGAVIPCTLPKGHAGKHRAPEPFAQDDLLRVTRGQMDYTTAVVGNAIDSGMTKEQFLTMVNIGWDAREKVRSALNRGGSRDG